MRSPGKPRASRAGQDRHPSGHKARGKRPDGDGREIRCEDDEDGNERVPGQRRVPITLPKLKFMGER
jgi:hypothetical protein